MLSKSDNLKIEEAIMFLVQSLETTRNNSKPVLMHSLRMGFMLHDMGYKRDVVIGAILHDVIEDTSVSSEELLNRFGQRVFDIVSACTIDMDVEGYRERYLKSYKASYDLGVNCLVVRAADLLDNSHYYHLAENNEQFKRLMEKFDDFLKIAEPKLSQEKLWQVLLERRAQLKEIQR